MGSSYSRWDLGGLGSHRRPSSHRRGRSASQAVMLNVPRRLRRRLVSLALLLFCLLNVLWLVLPADSAVRLAVNFNSARLHNLIRNAAVDRDAWLRKPAPYAVDLGRDVAYLIKTGYGTRHRIPAQQEAFSMAAGGAAPGEQAGRFLVVGDWTTVNETDALALGVEVHDAIKMVMETKIGPDWQGHHRFRKYRSLQEAVESGDEAMANRLGQSFGWELDALKFIMGLELVYKQMPNKKWYIILDDDTYLITPTLKLILGHLDSRKPHYIGNAVGDFKARFAHGGSGILLSGEALRRLFSRADIVAKAYFDSLDETWGDRLVATTLQKLGIYLNERYCHHFNGEPPEITRISRDRFCSPLLSFHGLRKIGAMEEVGHTLASIEKPVLWGDLWQYFGSYPIQELASQPVQHRQDHVGPGDEFIKTWDRVETAEQCLRNCERNSKWCLAWTHDQQSKECRGSPWMVIGTGDAEQKDSGVNWKKMAPLVKQCS
ncbi:hypothetical protein S40285_00709 [Stachybotrys chlorohalonatus IBT 40285]|uniref:N-acetylgalactosaminide beta-1,3-galactosyltransferase n=1 Tax=Stachybotrys chlorohalonatus (strain IBT 40285) TaxID=1283841 RepID=A0A084QRB5_STAC4|nr:hypothetical protein S40285_00709 [Stachybotrys chlorohalonata IBT 40285]